MAKAKRTAKKKAPKATRRALFTGGRRGGGKGAARAVRSGPRSQTLPGMEQVRDKVLDGYCEDAGEGLEQIEQGTASVTDAKSAALRRLREKGMSSYLHGGVRFTYTPGVDKVTVKRIKEKEATGATLIGGGDEDAVDELAAATASEGVDEAAS